MKMFVSDMDGTLLTKEFRISAENREAILRLKEAQIEFVVATGRIYYDARTICEKHGIYPYIISGNGSCIHDKDGNFIYGKWLSRRDVKKITDFLEKRKFSYGIGTTNQFVVLPNWKENFEGEGKTLSRDKMEFIEAETEKQHGFTVCPDLQDCLQEEGVCASISVITYDQTKIEELKKMLEPNQEVVVSISGSHNVEIMRAGASKGAALAYLAKKLQIMPDQVAAIGDGLNDMEMLAYAELGIAMENAFQELKDSSNYITLHCKENGVAHVIDKILKNQGGENHAFWI